MYYTNGGITIKKEYNLFCGSSYSHVECYAASKEVEKIFQTIAREFISSDISIDSYCSIHFILVSEDEFGTGESSYYAVLHITFEDSIEEEIKLRSSANKSLQEFKELLRLNFVKPVDVGTFMSEGFNKNSDLSLWLEFFLEGWK